MTEPRNELIESLYKGGYSLRKIAAAQGISYERVRQILKARGVTLRSSRARTLDGALKSLRTPISAKG